MLKNIFTRLFSCDIKRGGRRFSRSGLTLVELMIASAIGSMVSLGLASLLIFSSRMQKSILTQEIALSRAMKSIEWVNREIRMAVTPLRVTDEEDNSVIQGNRVVFARKGEAEGRRAIALISADGNPMTPADNQLVFDPDTSASDDEIVLTSGLSPCDAAGAFRYESSIKPLQVRLRLGDPVSGGQAQSNATTGPGKQGVEINIQIAPRNDSMD